MPIAKNAFSKQYVLDRIGARVATLKRIIGAGDTAAKWYDTDLAKRRKNYATDASVYVNRATDAYVIFERSERSDEDYTKLHAVLAQRPELPATSNSGYYRLSGKEYAEHNERQEAIKQGNDARRELALLEHAKIYLEEAPIQELTVTSLKSLGLLDAVKFRLNDVKEK